MNTTTFLQVKDNAQTRALDGSLNNTTTPITLSGLDTTTFPEVTTGFAVTIWDDLTYPNPGDDPNMEKALVTAASIDASGSLTLNRQSAKSHAGAPRVALLALAQHVSDLETAVNTIEGAMIESVVAGSNISVDDTDPAHPVISSSSQASIASIAMQLAFGAQDQQTSGSGSYNAGSYITLSSGSTSNSYSRVMGRAFAGFREGTPLNTWKFDSRVSFLMSVNNHGAGTAIILGQGDGAYAGQAFHPYRFVGFMLVHGAGDTVDIHCITCDGVTPDNATGWFAMQDQVVTVDQSTGVYMDKGAFTIDRRQDSVGFYLNGQLIATNTQYIPNASSSASQVTHYYAAAYNQTVAATVVFYLYSATVDYFTAT